MKPGREVIVCRNESEIADCLQVRRGVFTVEQGIDAAEDLDGKDSRAVHALARVDGKPVGTARVVIEGKTGRVGRVAVLRQWRKQGIGVALIEAVKKEARKRRVTEYILDAQISATGFYEKIGYVKTGREFMEVGIPHIKMQKKGELNGFEEQSFAQTQQGTTQDTRAEQGESKTAFC